MSQEFRLGFEIKMDHEYHFRPTQIEYWTEKEKFDSVEAHSPFHYHADLLTGLSLILLNPYFKTPLLKNSMPYNVCNKTWKNLDPHHQVYENMYSQSLAFRKDLPQTKAADLTLVEQFDRNLTTILENAQKPWGIEFNEFQDLVDTIFHLESRMQMPLIYNFQFQLPPQTIEKLHYLYSLLFHTRALVGYDYNSQLKDPTFQAVKVDSILDYIPRAEYVSQDALLYWKFLDNSKPFEKNPNVWNLLVKPTIQAFKSHSHNAFYLIENLPSSFLKTKNHSQLPEIQESLHLVQMNWLLGTEAGLIYRIREELYGLLGGYEKLFWTEELAPGFKTSNLFISTRMTEKDLKKLSA